MRHATSVRSVRGSVAALLLVVAAARPALAAAPEVQAGECLYLVGAPIGAAAAASAETSSDHGVLGGCALVATTSVNVGRADSAEAVFERPLVGFIGDCTAFAWVGHAFTTDLNVERGDVKVTLRGNVLGLLRSYGSLLDGTAAVVTATLELLRRDPESGALTVVASELLVDRTLQFGALSLDEPLARQLTAVVSPGETYVVRLFLQVVGSVGIDIADLGSPGSGRGAWYDSIEVCLSDPSASELQARLDALEAVDLEERLYRRECMPSTWLPEAQGGRLETARGLAADLLTRATASGAPGVNTHVAGARLESADAAIASGDYQRACRNLSDTVRALTTP